MHLPAGLDQFLGDVEDVLAVVETLSGKDFAIAADDDAVGTGGVAGEVTGLLRPRAFARLPLRLRRAVARLSGYRWIPFDPVLRDRKCEPARREAWLRDQYRHPEEHRHTVAQVRRWFRESGVDYIRTYPSLLMGEEPDALFTTDADYWPLEAWLSQIGWMATLGREGGLFVTIGRRHA